MATDHGGVTLRLQAPDANMDVEKGDIEAFALDSFSDLLKKYC